MATKTITCLHCGKQRTVSASDIDRKFCCVECLRAWQRKQKEFCPDCGVKMTKQNTYNRAGDGEHYWMDNVCKPCRIKRNYEAYRRRRESAGFTVAPGKKPKYLGVVCGRDWMLRDNRMDWKNYMAENPHYFAEAFNLAPTAENIKTISASIF